MFYANLLDVSHLGISYNFLLLFLGCFLQSLGKNVRCYFLKGFLCSDISPHTLECSVLDSLSTSTQRFQSHFTGGAPAWSVNIVSFVYSTLLPVLLWCPSRSHCGHYWQVFFLCFYFLSNSCLVALLSVCFYLVVRAPYIC